MITPRTQKHLDDIKNINEALDTARTQWLMSAMTDVQFAHSVKSHIRGVNAHIKKIEEE